MISNTFNNEFNLINAYEKGFEDGYESHKFDSLLIETQPKIEVNTIQTAIPATMGKMKLLFDWKNNIDYEILEN